jgi:hypothetical protein
MDTILATSWMLMHLMLPMNGCTLLKTPRAINTIDRCRDKYCYFGLEHGILSIIEHNLPFPYDTIEVKINIDGVPLFKSTNTQFWPILCQIKTYAPFLVGLFCWEGKPHSIDTFPLDFIAECTELQAQGVPCGNRVLRFSISAFICDAPARAFIKVIKGHSGYHACERCQDRGNYVENRVTFSHENDHIPRTDDAFTQNSYVQHQLGFTPLLTLGYPCVTGFPLDYMHMVWLGVVKRLLHFLMKGPRRLCRLS